MRPVVIVERATVYRAVGGRRYFTKAAALRGYAKAKFRAKHPCECEDGDYVSGYGGYTCPIHDAYDRVMPRYLKFLKHKMSDHEPHIDVNLVDVLKKTLDGLPKVKAGE